MKTRRSNFYRFGGFVLDARDHRFMKGGRQAPLRPKAFEILRFFVQHPGHLISKEQLMDEIWPETAVGEGVLTHYIWELREVLEDDFRNPQWIETHPKLGYEFIGDVVQSDGPRSLQKPLLFYGALILLAIMTASLYTFIEPSDDLSGLIEIRPLTNSQGLELGPSFSSDGTRVVFSSQGKVDGTLDLYLKCTDCQRAQQLTKHPSWDLGAEWSPDGQEIAFIRWEPGAGTAFVKLLEPVGGHERTVTEILVDVDFELTPAGNWPAWCYMDWSTERDWLAIRDKLTGGRFGIFLVSTKTGERRPLSDPPTGFSDAYPAFSRDGRRLVFSRSCCPHKSNLFSTALNEQLQPVGQLEQITCSENPSTHPVWVADRPELVYAEGHYYESGLHRVSLAESPEVQPWVWLGDGLMEPEISTTGKRLVFVRARFVSNLYRIELNTDEDSQPKALLATSFSRSSHPKVSPDGTQIAFTSDRSGSSELWLADWTGDTLTRLTFFGEGTVERSVWSPDGGHIAFEGHSGHGNVWVIPSQGGKPRCLTTGPALNTSPTWSRDGRWVYFRSRQGGEWKTRKARIDGSELLEVEGMGGSSPHVALNGNAAFFVKNGLLMRIADGDTKPVADNVHQILKTTTRGPFFLRMTGDKQEIHYWDATTGKSFRVQDLPRRGVTVSDVSPDGRWILFSRFDLAESDLLLAENFH